MYQQLTIVGNVGRDATLKYTSAGVAVCDFSVAVSKVTGSGENKQEKTTWFRVTCWRSLAEIAGEYVKKGAKILCVGEVSASAFVDKSGVQQVSLELNADTFKLLSSRSEMEQRNETRQSEQAPPSEPAATPKQRSGKRKAQDEGDNDIPF